MGQHPELKPGVSGCHCSLTLGKLRHWAWALLFQLCTQELLVFSQRQMDEVLSPLHGTGRDGTWAAQPPCTHSWLQHCWAKLPATLSAYSSFQTLDLPCMAGEFSLFPQCSREVKAASDLQSGSVSESENRFSFCT